MDPLVPASLPPVLFAYLCELSISFKPGVVSGCGAHPLCGRTDDFETIRYVWLLGADIAVTI